MCVCVTVYYVSIMKKRCGFVSLESRCVCDFSGHAVCVCLYVCDILFLMEIFSLALMNNKRRRPLAMSNHEKEKELPSLEQRKIRQAMSS